MCVRVRVCLYVCVRSFPWRFPLFASLIVRALGTSRFSRLVSFFERTLDSPLSFPLHRRLSCESARQPLVWWSQRTMTHCLRIVVHASCQASYLPFLARVHMRLVRVSVYIALPRLIPRFRENFARGKSVTKNGKESFDLRSEKCFTLWGVRLTCNDSRDDSGGVSVQFSAVIVVITVSPVNCARGASGKIYRSNSCPRLHGHWRSSDNIQQAESGWEVHT